MLPSREEAERLLLEAESRNPGPWGEHSRVAARCAERIASNCADLDADKAYILGLLHDIGRRFGVRHLGHVLDGYRYMLSLGYDEAARVCLSHSFNNGVLEEYVGRFDVTPEESKLLRDALSALHMDEYDRLIQLCDALADSEGVVDIQARMEDVRRRYGFYPQAKWDKNLSLLSHFKRRMGRDVYAVVRQEEPAP